MFLSQSTINCTPTSSATLKGRDYALLLSFVSNIFIPSTNAFAVQADSPGAPVYEDKR
jgi:hypothetical protein